MPQLPPPNAMPFLSPGRRYLSNPRGLNRWRAKLANARYNQATIVVMGDSITLGGYANDVLSSDEATWRIRGWPPQLRSLFADRYGDPGEGAIWAADPRVSVSGGATQPTSSSVGSFKTSVSVVGSSQVGTWTTPACTDIVIYSWWDDSGTQAFSYNIDGAGWVVSDNFSGSNVFYSVAITGLADTTHTVQVRGNAAGGASTIPHIGAYKLTASGVAVHRFPKSGTMLKEYSALYDGSSTAAIRSIRSTTSALSADLVIIAFSANNVTAGWNTYAQTPANVAAGHALIIDQIISDGACVLCVGGPWRDPDSYSIPYTQQQYDDAIKAVCTARTHAAYLDLKKLWVSYDDGNAAGFYIDTIHPKLLGHADIATAVYQAIGGV